MEVENIQHESVESGLKFVQTTSVLRRKRVLPSQSSYSSNLSSPLGAPLKRQNSGLKMEDISNPSEALPKDLFLKILCKVNHSDLKQLLLVSKSFNQATLIAKKFHFAFNTPATKPVFKRQSYMEDGFDEMIDNAPKQQRDARSRLDNIKLSSIAISLFALTDTNHDGARSAY